MNAASNSRAMVLGIIALTFLFQGCGSVDPVPYHFGPSPIGTVFSTSRFLIIYEGLEYPGGWGGGGAGGSLIHGNSILRSDGRTDFVTQSYRGTGITMVWLYGRVFVVEQNGKFLRFKDTVVELGQDRAVILVDKQDNVSLPTKAEAAKVLAKLHPYYRSVPDDAFEGAPPDFAALRAAYTIPTIRK